MRPLTSIISEFQTVHQLCWLIPHPIKPVDRDLNINRGIPCPCNVKGSLFNYQISGLKSMVKSKCHIPDHFLEAHMLVGQLHISNPVVPVLLPIRQSLEFVKYSVLIAINQFKLQIICKFLGFLDLFHPFLDFFLKMTLNCAPNLGVTPQSETLCLLTPTQRTLFVAILRSEIEQDAFLAKRVPSLQSHRVIHHLHSDYTTVIL